MLVTQFPLIDKERSREKKKAIALTEELPEIVSIVVRRVLFRVVTRRDHGLLVSIDRIVVEEVARLLVDLPRTVLVAPEVEEPFVHRPRAQFLDLAQPPEDGELGIGDAHVCFVGLHVGCRDGLQFGGWGGG